jgi:hypothetical protein
MIGIHGRERELLGNFPSYSIPELIIHLNIQSIDFFIAPEEKFWNGLFQDTIRFKKFYFVHRGPEAEGVLSLQRVLKRLAEGKQRKPSTKKGNDFKKYKPVYTFAMGSEDVPRMISPAERMMAHGCVHA